MISVSESMQNSGNSNPDGKSDVRNNMENRLELSFKSEDTRDLPFPLLGM